VLGFWLSRSLAGALELSPLAAAASNSLLVAGAAALVAAAFALPVTLLAVRHPSRPARLAERLSHTGYALPGVVVALALVFFGTRVALPLYQTVAMLVLALVILFLPQALGATRAALLQVPPRLEEAARSLGRSQLGALATVTAPLAAAGVTAGAALVFLTAIKELPAMLILAPIEFETLSTSIWKSTSVGSFERGALPALVLLAVSALPLYLMTLRDR
jgi:iron(III) transport system permease protein